MKCLKTEYEYFLTLCQTENVSRAAEKLGIVQGGLSKALKKLELEHQTPLFYRQGRGIALTTYARELEKHLRAIMLLSDQAQSELSSSLQEVKGVIKMGAHSTIAAGYAANFIPSLIEEYPLLDIQLSFAPSKDVTAKVVAGELDLGLAVDPLAYPDLVIRKIATEAVWALGRNRRPLKEIIYFNPDMIGIAKTLRSFKKYKQVPIKDYDVLVAMALASDGIFLLPESVAKRAPKLLTLQKKERVYSICLVYRADHPKTKAFTTILKRILN